MAQTAAASSGTGLSGELSAPFGPREQRPGSPLQALGGQGGGGPRAHREVLEASEGEGAFFVQQEPGQVHRATSHGPAKVVGKGRSCKGAAEPSPARRPPLNGRRPRQSAPSPRASGCRRGPGGGRLFLFRPGRGSGPERRALTSPGRETRPRPVRSTLCHTTRLSHVYKTRGCCQRVGAWHFLPPAASSRRPPPSARSRARILGSTEPGQVTKLSPRVPLSKTQGQFLGGHAEVSS